MKEIRTIVLPVMSFLLINSVHGTNGVWMDKVSSRIHAQTQRDRSILRPVTATAAEEQQQQQQQQQDQSGDDAPTTKRALAGTRARLHTHMHTAASTILFRTGIEAGCGSTLRRSSAINSQPGRTPWCSC